MKILYGAIVFAIIPGILLALFITSMSLAGRTASPESKLSARAGFWAGLVALAVYVVHNVPRMPNFSDFLHAETLSTLNWFALLAGLTTGFVAHFVVRVILPTRMIGLLSLTLSATSSIALFAYFFDSDVRGFTLYFTLGCVFGLLVHLVLFPKKLR